VPIRTNASVKGFEEYVRQERGRPLRDRQEDFDKPIRRAIDALPYPRGSAIRKDNSGLHCSRYAAGKSASEDLREGVGPKYVMVDSGYAEKKKGSVLNNYTPCQSLFPASRITNQISFLLLFYYFKWHRLRYPKRDIVSTENRLGEIGCANAIIVSTGKGSVPSMLWRFGLPKRVGPE